MDFFTETKEALVFGPRKSEIRKHRVECVKFDSANLEIFQANLAISEQSTLTMHMFGPIEMNTEHFEIIFSILSNVIRKIHKNIMNENLIKIIDASICSLPKFGSPSFEHYYFAHMQL